MPVLVIKKYPNRRLYHTKESRYITLEDLATLVREGTDVVVHDATNGADLTQVTLTQIILESRGGARLLPIPLLVRLIRLGDEALAEFFGRYVSWALEMYMNARQGARALMPLNPLANAPFAATDALARLVLGATQWGNSASSQPPMAAVTVPVPDAPPSDPLVGPDPPTGAEIAAAIEAETAHVHGEVSHVADDLARLRREIDELKRSMVDAVQSARESREPAKTSRGARATKTARKAPAKKR